MKHVFYFRLGLLLLLCFGAVIFASAEEAESGEEAVPYACTTAMISEGQSVVETYEQFLNEYLKVDTPSSEQFENALEQYRFTVMALDGIYSARISDDTTSDSAKTLQATNDEVKDCALKRDIYLNYIKTLLQKQLMGSAVSKVTFKVVDGLKAMNSDLGDLSEVFQQTFPGLFNKMANDLPCFARSCVSQ